MSHSTAPHFGLPECLWVPIAATGMKAIESEVGTILNKPADVTDRAEVFVVRANPRKVSESPRVPLWQDPRAEEFRKRLFPELQVWVHVDFAGYREAYKHFMNMPGLSRSIFLDHIQNRKAMRLRDSSHPYLRLCPVKSAVNTSGGHRAGGAGMEGSP